MDPFPLKEEYDKVEDRELGRGTYGIVTLWKRKEGLPVTEVRPKYVAIKPIVHSDKDYFAKMRKREIYILETVQSGCHNNIIKYYGSLRDDSFTTEQTVLVMEACHGDLDKLIQSERNLSDDELRMLGVQMLCGLHYLHCLDGHSMILHRCFMILFKF